MIWQSRKPLVGLLVFLTLLIMRRRVNVSYAPRRFCAIRTERVWQDIAATSARLQVIRDEEFQILEILIPLILSLLLHKLDVIYRSVFFVIESRKLTGLI